MIIYGLKTCDTCRKALKYIPDADFRDMRAEGVPDAVLAAAHAQFGGDLLNTRSTTWRNLSEDQRASAPLALIAEHPTVMKRPLIDTGDTLYLGWTPQTRAALGV